MSIVKVLLDMIADCEARGVEPKTVVLSPRKLMELKRECYNWLEVSGVGPGDNYFAGLSIKTRRLTGFCRACGAPAEPNVCSYCRTPSEIVELE